MYPPFALSTISSQRPLLALILVLIIALRASFPAVGVRIPLRTVVIVIVLIGRTTIMRLYIRTVLIIMTRYVISAPCGCWKS